MRLSEIKAAIKEIDAMARSQKPLEVAFVFGSGDEKESVRQIFWHKTYRLTGAWPWIKKTLNAIKSQTMRNMTSLNQIKTTLLSKGKHA